MSYFIGIEDLVTNALIELVERTGKRSISLSQINRYGDSILASLRSEGLDVILSYTHDDTDQFFSENSNLLKVNERETDIDITLNDDVSTDYLRKKFRINLALCLLPAFISQNSVGKII